MKTIFTMNVSNTIDLITNSSSELFVLKGKTKDVIIELLDSTYPAWRNEYEEPKNISELTVSELETYFSYACSPHMWPNSKKDYPVFSGFAFDELYEKENSEFGFNRGGYKLKNNVINPESKWDENFVTEENIKEISKKLSPNMDMWFLFSLGENPNWEMQEKLMCVADRYHLG
jgi:hypothetical protein